MSKATTDAYRNGWDALRMVREAVEAHMPAGALPPGEHVGPEPVHEGEALAKAITEIGLERDRLRDALKPVSTLEWLLISMAENSRSGFRLWNDSAVPALRTYLAGQPSFRPLSLLASEAPVDGGARVLSSV